MLDLAGPQRRTSGHPPAAIARPVRNPAAAGPGARTVSLGLAWPGLAVGAGFDLAGEVPPRRCLHQPPPAPPAVRPWRVTTTRTFPATADQVSAARRFVAGLAEGFPAAEDALLCLSEVVTNATQHSHSARPGGRFTVRASYAPGHLRVEVEDDGGPWQMHSPHHDHGGRGLAILSALTCWDITDSTGHRTIWFEITA